MENVWYTIKEEHIQRNYQRNKKLIDLDEIPNDLREIIHNKWIEKKINDRSKILPYFMKYRLKELTEKLGDFKMVVEVSRPLISEILVKVNNV